MMVEKYWSGVTTLNCTNSTTFSETSNPGSPCETHASGDDVPQQRIFRKLRTVINAKTAAGCNTKSNAHSRTNVPFAIFSLRMASISAKMAPHTQAANLTIKQQYQPHQWPWSTNSNSNSNNSTTSNSTANSSSSLPASVNTHTQTQPASNAANSVISPSITVTPVNKLKRLQPVQSEASHGGSITRSNSTNTIANGAKRIRATSVEKVNKSVGTNTTNLSGPPGLVAVGSSLAAATSSTTTKKLTQMAIVAASSINHQQQHHLHHQQQQQQQQQQHQQQQISTGTTTTTITKNTRNFTATPNGNADLSNANKITAGRATTLKTTATASATSTTTATAEAEAEITTTTELMTTTSTVLQQKSIIKTPIKGSSASLEKYLNLLQQQQLVKQTDLDVRTLTTSISPTTSLKKVERKTARIAPTVSVNRKVSHSTQGGLGVGQPKKPITIAPRTADPKLGVNFNQQQMGATNSNSQTKQQEQIVKSQQPTVLLTAIRIPQQQQQSTQTQTTQPQSSQQTPQQPPQQQPQQQQQQQFKQTVQQQSPISSPPRTPTKLGSAVFQFHPQTTAVMPNLVQIPNLVPTQPVSSATKLNTVSTTVSATTSSPSQSANLLMNNASHGLTAARLNNGTTQLFMNGAVIKLHQIQQQQQVAVSSAQQVPTSQQNLTMEATTVNMNLNGLISKPPALSATMPLSATATIGTNQQPQQGKTFALHTQPSAQLFQQTNAATAAAFAPQQLFMTPTGGIFLNAAALPTMLTSGLTAASLQQALTQAAQANVPALHPLQPTQPQATQLPNITAIIQQQQQQQAQQTQAQHNFHQLLANIPQAVLQNLQATTKFGQGPQFVPIPSHLFLNPQTPALASNGSSASLTNPITISTSTIPSGSTTVTQPLSPPPLVATVSTFSTTTKPIMNTLNSQKIIIASATTGTSTAKAPVAIKPISSTEPPKLVPVQMNKPSISIAPVLTNPPKLVTPSAPVPKLVLSASVASKATSTTALPTKDLPKPCLLSLEPPALAPASIPAAIKLPLPGPPINTQRAIDNKSPPALNPLSLDCGSSNDSGFVANSSDTEDKSLTIDLCSPGTPDFSPQKKEEEITKSVEPPSPDSPTAEPEEETEFDSKDDEPTEPELPERPPQSSPPPLRLLPPTIETCLLENLSHNSSLPPSQKSPKSLILEQIKLKLPDKPDDQPQESMSSDQDSTSQSPLDEQQSSMATPSESQRSTTPIDLSPPSIDTDLLATPPPGSECAKSPILSQPKTIRFPALNGAHHNFGRKGFRRLSDGRLFGLCYWNNCDAQFDTSSKLLDHLQIEHVNSQSGPFACLWDGCKVHNKESCSRRWLERHVLSHGGSKPHKCIVAKCGMRFGSQLALEKHVNNHFSNSDSAGSSKRSSDPPLPKVLRKTGKKLRYRRQPWSARRFDFFDIGVMEGLQHRLILAGSVASARRGTVTFRGQAAGRRTTSTGTEVFVKWYPREIISDDWIPEAEVTLTREISIQELSPDQRFELEAQLKTNRKANAELLSDLHELNLKLQTVADATSSSCCSSSSSSSRSSSSFSFSSSGCSSMSTPIPFNSRTGPKKLRKPSKDSYTTSSSPLSSVLSSSSSSLLSSGSSNSSSSCRNSGSASSCSSSTSS
ncbi:zinc finger protein jing homolog isoform X2 [Wyeomyia smithii]|uniref:zinc finger protein jing homolog isoform X2 n=2 Tax=Wyeomyia smithii TaxID=174621 RepID=UPI002467F488|nr:zinc finger protein jing homolog isoform X2 [Wyeomyia smithii]